MSKRERALLMVLLFVVVLSWGAYRYRLRIVTSLWHLRHGEVLAISDYLVPAPRNWYVEDLGTESQILIRLDTEDRTGDPTRDKLARFPAGITLLSSTSRSTMEQLAVWTSLRSSMLTKKGIEPALRSFSFDGEKLSCVGGDRFSGSTKSRKFYESDPNTWSCKSSGRLEVEIMATDADMPQVWEIVSRIHKRS